MFFSVDSQNFFFFFTLDSRKRDYIAEMYYYVSVWGIFWASESRYSLRSFTSGYNVEGKPG